MSDIANNLKTLREGFGLTQQQVADWLGIHRTALAMYETAARKPSLGHLEKLATLFAVELGELISGPIQVPPIGAGLRQIGPLSQQCLVEIASFFRIVRNYQRMQRLLAESA